MFSAVFWNIGRKEGRDRIGSLVAALQQQEEADAILLAECSDPAVKSVLRALNQPGRSPRFTLLPTEARVRILLRDAQAGTVESARHPYYSVVELPRRVGVSLRLVVTHMVSLASKTPQHIDKELIALATAIRAAEVREGHAHTRTILIGDLNANPFSEGVVDAIGLHGVMSRAVAGRGIRQASHRAYPFFFNPMWQFFGDGHHRPAGSCYYEPEGDHTGYYWNVFDQVLIRPCLLPYYDSNSVSILHMIGRTPLTGADWVPDRSAASDHLPVRVRLTC